MKRRTSRENNVFGLSFMDVLANAVGGLAFLLILAVMMVGAVTFLPPRITTEQLPRAYDGQPYEVWLAARDGLGKFEWQLGEGTSPAGLELDPQSGRLGGTITLAEDAGASVTYEFEVLCTARPAEGAESTEPDRRKLAITVLRDAPATVVPLAILTETLPDAYGGQPYPLTFAAEGGQPPYAWEVEGELPLGLALNESGRFIGSPRQTGTFRFRATISDTSGQQDSQSFTLTISEKHPAPVPPPPLAIITKEIPAAVARKDYVLYPAAEGGTPPYRWSITSGKPAWLGTDGVSFSGSPSPDDVGKVEMHWAVTDSKGKSVATDVPIALAVFRPEGPQYRPLIFRNEKLAEARVGQEYHVPLSAEGGTPPYRWSISRPLPPLGLQFSSDDGVIRGTPDSIGSVVFEITVSDSSNQAETVQRELVLRVRPAEDKLQVLTTMANEGRVGQPYEIALSATGGHPPYHWRLSDGSVPAGLRLGEEAGRIVGTPTEAGTWNASFVVSDAEQQAADDPLPLEMTMLTSQGHTKLLVSTQEIPTLLKGNTTNLALACEGGRPPYRWEIIEQQPLGLDTDNALLVGNPRQTGVFETKFRAKDSSGQSVDVVLPITIRAMLPAWMVYVLAALLAVAILAVALLYLANRRGRPQPLRINTESLPHARASCEYAVQLSCIGGVPPYVWSVSDGELPQGLELVDDGRLIGCPLEGIGVDQTQDFPFSALVRDANGATAVQQL